MTVVSEYAERHERQRRSSILIRAAFVTILGVGFAFFPMALRLRIAIPAAIVGYVVALVIPVIFVRGPREPTRLVTRHGTWTATVPLFQLADAVAKPGRLRPEAEILGKLTIRPDAVVWVPNAAGVKSFGARRMEWDASWAIFARRLPGRGQVHLCLARSGEPVVDVWLHFASAMPIP